MFEFELLGDGVDVWEVAEAITETDEETEGAAETGCQDHYVFQKTDSDAPHRYYHHCVRNVQR